MFLRLAEHLLMKASFGNGIIWWTETDDHTLGKREIMAGADTIDIDLIDDLEMADLRESISWLLQQGYIEQDTSIEPNLYRITQLGCDHVTDWIGEI